MNKNKHPIANVSVRTLRSFLSIIFRRALERLGSRILTRYHNRLLETL